MDRFICKKALRAYAMLLKAKCIPYFVAIKDYGVV
jgi:hypothetical protein